jgi:hypothetical protein
MADDKTETPDLPYQQAGQVEQLRRERENAVAYGQESRVAAVDKQLDALGVTEHEKRTSAAQKRQAAAEESEDADDKPEQSARSTPPQGRSAKPTQKS